MLCYAVWPHEIDTRRLNGCCCDLAAVEGVVTAVGAGAVITGAATAEKSEL